MTASVHLRDGQSHLAIVQDGKVIAHTWNIALSHAEFVRRSFGQLPEGAWVGTVQKGDGEVMAFNSRTFYGNQLPAPQEVWDAVKAVFQ
jgi:hypothetical protein